VARSRGETKPERIARAVAAAVQAGKEWHLPGVDFNDPNRPKTCLEVDFPILPINHVAAIEGNAGKPIYQMSKWWARRRSSVFRAMLIAAATKAPDDPAEAAKLVWDAYYGNHQKNEAFRKLKVADIFMGGGTTVVEGARLGMQMYGNDLNPVAWFVVKNELAQVDPADVQKLLDQIEAEVKPQIMPFYACDCPRGHKGKWTHKPTQRVMGPTFDPLALTPQQRPEYEYEGPEIIYTFWCKHGPCQNGECGHRTPIMASPVVAVKSLSVGVWRDRTCAKCSQTFDVEAEEARMAPAALFVCSPQEPPYTIRNGDGSFDCPHCGHVNRPALGSSDRKDKKIDLTLLVHPDWLKGAPGKAAGGLSFGGSVTDDAESTARWNAERGKTLKLIEVRGPLPQEIECPDTKEMMGTDDKGGTVPKRSTFTCMEGTCGKQWDVLDSIKKTKKSGPVAMYTVQGYCPACDKAGQPYSGRFFAAPQVRGFDGAHQEWEQRREADFAGYWPRSEVPFGFMTSMNNGGIPNHGFTHWWTMFNPRQLLGLSSILRKLSAHTEQGDNEAELILGSLPQLLRYHCMLTIWQATYDKMIPHFSSNNYYPKATPVEGNLFAVAGAGTFSTLREWVGGGYEWAACPWEIVSPHDAEQRLAEVGDGAGGKSYKVYPADPVLTGSQLDCCSSTQLAVIKDGSQDMVITDPPFGGLLHYSELADFFYVWLRLVLKEKYPDKFTAEYTPKALEAVANRARQPEDADAFYQKILTECWREAARILKPSGILAFTFHHSEDEPWVAVLESLFQAGFYLEAAYPIRSDETKGEGAKPGTFGSQLIEYDIIHVCRKRIEEPNEVSWARLRRQIMQDVRQLQDILTKHQTAGLQEADMQVIRRGKALEYYSKHYGKVYVEKGREFTVREALLAINQLLDDQADSTAETPPVLAEPYTRQFFRLFADKTSVPRDQMQKYLRGTGVAPQEFIDRGWCEEKAKVFTPISPLDWALSMRGIRRDAISRDFDQVMFMVGACCEGSGIKLSDTLDNQNFKPHPATESVLDWLIRHGSNTTIKTAARTALQLYRSWVAKNQKKVQVERTLFDLIDEEA
jgi:SAM-dependent methyltransferase